MISEDIELARRFFEIAASREELQAFSHGLSITTYRYVPTDLATRAEVAEVQDYLNELNQAIQGRMEGCGEAFVSNAVLGEVYALRMCIVNFRTKLSDLTELAEITIDLGRVIDTALRPASLR